MQRILADAGVASRRACEELILAGRVRVNGNVVRTLPAFASVRKDRVEVDGVRIERRPSRVVLALHKPARVLVTASDESHLDRATVMELVKHHAKATLRPAGRLPWNVNGLVILTNDGELIHKLTHRSFGVVKTYEVVVKGAVSDEQLQGLTRQSRLVAKRAARERGEAGSMPAWDAVCVAVAGVTGANTVLRVSLRESKDIPIGDVFFAAGFIVRRITRVAIGSLDLRGLAVGAWRELKDPEVALLGGAPPPLPPVILPRAKTRPPGPARPDRIASPGNMGTPRNPRDSRDTRSAPPGRSRIGPNADSGSRPPRERPGRRRPPPR